VLERPEQRPFGIAAEVGSFEQGNPNVINVENDGSLIRPICRRL
jgi:hypothetical protein